MGFDEDRGWWERRWGARAEHEWAKTCAALLSVHQRCWLLGIGGGNGHTRAALVRKGYVADAGGLTPDGERLRRYLTRNRRHLSRRGFFRIAKENHDSTERR